MPIKYVHVLIANREKCIRVTVIVEKGPILREFNATYSTK